MVQMQFVCVSYAFVWMDMYFDGQFLAHVGTRRKALYSMNSLTGNGQCGEQGGGASTGGGDYT